MTMMVGMAALAPVGVSAEGDLAIVVGDGAVVTDKGQPEGTAIATAAEFAAMEPDGKYYLSADITISESYEKTFTGKFDGNGHTVTTTAPLFLLVNGTVCNLKLEGTIRVEAGTTVEGNIVGAVANRACVGGNADFYNIETRVSLTSFATGMAGIVGRGGNGTNDTYVLTIKNCTNYGAITTDFASSNKDSGGMIGYFVGNHPSGVAQLVIEDCANYGIVNACGRPGGIVGVCDSSVTIKNCVNNAAVQAIDNYAGGIAARLGDNYGKLDNSKGTYILVENCVNNGDVSYSGTKATQVAGICGYTTPSKSMIFRNCVNNGNLSAVFSGQNASFGGILAAGGNLSDALQHKTDSTKQINGVMLFENCTNNGNITVPDGWSKNAYVGGIVGYAQSHADLKITNCVNKGDLTNRGAAGGSGLQNHTGGIAGYIRYRRVLTDCYNYGDIIANVNMTGGTVSAAGIAAYVHHEARAEKSSEFTRCGNLGNVTGGLNCTGAIVGYHWGSNVIGANFNYCFNTGDIVGAKHVGGLIGYVNSNKITAKYCYIAGKISRSTPAVAVTTGDDVKQWNSAGGAMYTFNYAGTDYYFYAPLAGKVTITGNVVTIDAVDAITTVADGGAVENGKLYTYDYNGDKYLFKANVNGTVSIVNGVLTAGGSNAQKIAGLTIPVLDHAADGWALFYSNTWNNDIDMSTNIIAEDSAAFDYVCGAAGVINFLGHADGDVSARYAVDRFESGEVAYTLNRLSGTDTYRQNLLSGIFEIDKFPTTEASHAKIIENAGTYTNLLFPMNPDCTPDTGDATIYVVAALAVSALALGGLVIAKKKKIRD